MTLYRVTDSLICSLWLLLTTRWTCRESSPREAGLVVIASGIWVVGSLAARGACSCLSGLGGSVAGKLFVFQLLAGLWPPLQSCSVGSRTHSDAPPFPTHFPFFLWPFQAPNISCPPTHPLPGTDSLMSLPGPEGREGGPGPCTTPVPSWSPLAPHHHLPQTPTVLWICLQKVCALSTLSRGRLTPQAMALLFCQVH